jgi:hypothetical protein
MKHPATFVSGTRRARSQHSRTSLCVQFPYDHITSPFWIGNAVSTSPADSFEPVLNVPALGSFLFIALVFSLLRWRVGAIERAADRRTTALEGFRTIKSQALEGKADEEKVQLALEDYKRAVEEVENLRTIIPGVRIAPPPSTASLSTERSNENAAAARQFLGMELDTLPQQQSNEEGKQGLTVPLVLLLGLVAASQVGLLFLFLQDPMSSSSSF